MKGELDHEKIMKKFLELREKHWELINRWW